MNQKILQTTTLGLVSMINDPDVIAAEQNPSSVDTEALAKKVAKRNADLAKALNIPDERSASLSEPYIDQIKTDPKGFRKYLQYRLLTATNDAAQAAGLMQPSGPIMSTGAESRQVQTGLFGPQPGTPVPGTPTKQVLPVTSRSVERTDPLTGNLYRDYYDENNNFVRRELVARPQGGKPAQPGPQPTPAAPTQAAPPQGAAPTQGPLKSTDPNAAKIIQQRNADLPDMTVIPAGANMETAKVLIAQRNAARDATEAAADARYFYNQALDKLQAGAPTGTGAAWLKTVTSIPGIDKAFPQGVDLAELDKYLMQSTVATTKKLGFDGTDMARDMIKSITGDTSLPNAANRAVVRANRALQASFPIYYADGQENAMARTGDIFELPRYKSAWAKVDRRAILMQSLIDNNDDEGKAILAHELGIDDLGSRDKVKQTAALKRYRDFQKQMQKLDELRQGYY